MSRARHWSVIPIAVGTALAVILVIAVTALSIVSYMHTRTRPRPLSTRAASDLANLSREKRKASPDKIDQLPRDDPDRAVLLSVAEQLRSLSPLENGADLLAFQSYQQRLAEIASRLERMVDDVSPGNLDLVEGLKAEVSTKQAELWKLKLALIDKRIAKLSEVERIQEEVKLLRNEIGQLDAAAQEEKGAEAGKFRQKLRQSEKSLQNYQPTLMQIENLIPCDPSSRNSLVALGIVLAILAIKIGRAHV